MIFAQKHKDNKILNKNILVFLFPYKIPIMLSIRQAKVFKSKLICHSLNKQK